MDCRRCQHWQGNRYSKWADCNWVIGQLEPKLFEEKNDFGIPFRIPFDPHDLRYYNINLAMHRLCRDAFKHGSTIDGVRIAKVGNLRFIQTREDYHCEFYEGHCSINGHA